jgi:transcriptional regulator GlxA family with amidase domain
VGNVVIVGHPGVLGMELVGARDIFEMGNYWLAQEGREPRYSVQLASVDGRPVPLWRGLELGPAVALDRCSEPIDTLVVAGGLHAPDASVDEALVAAVARAAGRSRRVAGMCTASFILAATGLLDGKRATTHWLFGDELAQRYPAVEVDTGPIFIREGTVWTSAGITSAFDLMLALLEEDLGVEAARSVARGLVVFLRRTGNQAQYSAQLAMQLADRAPFQELVQHIADHPAEDLSLPALAARVHMSPRHFTRVFRAQLGMSPARYVERSRLETARRRLEESDMSIEAVAATCGFGSSETLRRIFVQSLSVSPAEYRRRFGTRTPQPA